MSSDPLISVIIPAFNPGAFLREAVDSVLAQTCRDWELLIVDDGSTQDITQYIPADSRISVFHQKNKGLSSARNMAIMRSRGTYVAFLDADDVWLPDKLERQMAHWATKPDAVFCHTQMQFIDDNSKPGGLGWGGAYQTYDDLLDGCGVCVSSVIIRRETLFAAGLFDPLLHTAQDYDLWMKATRHGPMAGMLEALTLYRMHSGNMSRNYMRTHQELCDIMTRHKEMWERKGDAVHVAKCKHGLFRTRRSTAMQAFNAAIGSLKAGSKTDCLRHLIAGMRVSPMTIANQFIERIVSRVKPAKPAVSVETNEAKPTA